ncbi:MAG TPA: hypothetical protein VIL49_00125, partial [Capillimicrobium sp.]
MSRPALLCALLAGPFAALCVAGQRVGLALALLLGLALAAAALQAGGIRSRAAFALALGLAAQPLLRDAGWVTACAVAACLVAGAAAVAPAGSWAAVAHTAVAPLRAVAGGHALTRALAGLAPAVSPRRALAVT